MPNYPSADHRLYVYALRPPSHSHNLSLVIPYACSISKLLLYFMHAQCQSPCHTLCTSHVRTYAHSLISVCVFTHAPTILVKNQRAFYALSWKRVTAGAWIIRSGIVYDSHIWYDKFTSFLDLDKFLNIVYLQFIII